MNKKFGILCSLLIFGILISSFVLAHQDSYNSEYLDGFQKIFGSITGKAVDSGSSVSNTTILLIAIDSLGILIGFTVLIFLLSSLEPFRGRLRTSYTFIGWGIFLQVTALLYTVIFVRLHLFPVPFGLDIHHLLMTVGIVFFALAIYNLREVVKGVTTS